MTLDEAIEQFGQAARGEAVAPYPADLCQQLADWLTDLRMHRESEPRKSTVVAQVTLTGEQVQQVKRELEDEFLESVKAMNAENEKLKEDLHWARRQNDMLMHNARVGAEKPQPDAKDAITLLKEENAKLRELVRELLPCYMWSDCYGVTCSAADTDRCPHPCELEYKARELGVEVGDA